MCLLNSFENPAHELTLKRIIAEEAPELSVSISYEVWRPRNSMYRRAAMYANVRWESSMDAKSIRWLLMQTADFWADPEWESVEDLDIDPLVVPGSLIARAEDRCLELAKANDEQGRTELLEGLHRTVSSGLDLLREALTAEGKAEELFLRFLCLLRLAAKAESLVNCWIRDDSVYFAFSYEEDDYPRVRLFKYVLSKEECYSLTYDLTHLDHALRHRLPERFDFDTSQGEPGLEAWWFDAADHDNVGDEASLVAEFDFTRDYFITIETEGRSCLDASPRVDGEWLNQEFQPTTTDRVESTLQPDVERLWSITSPSVLELPASSHPSPHNE